MIKTLLLRGWAATATIALACGGAVAENGNTPPIPTIESATSIGHFYAGGRPTSQLSRRSSDG